MADARDFNKEEDFVILSNSSRHLIKYSKLNFNSFNVCEGYFHSVKYLVKKLVGITSK